MGGLTGVKVTSQTTSSIIFVNPIINVGGPITVPPSWGLGIVCTVSSGASLTYSVQVTADPLPTANGNWNNHDTLNAQTGSANGNVAFPITGLRLNVTAYASGSVNLGVAIWP